MINHNCSPQLLHVQYQFPIYSEIHCIWSFYLQVLYLLKVWRNHKIRPFQYDIFLLKALTGKLEPALNSFSWYNCFYKRARKAQGCVLHFLRQSDRCGLSLQICKRQMAQRYLVMQHELTDTHEHTDKHTCTVGQSDTRL